MAKILILTSETGGGHVSLAEAYRDLLECEHEVELVDPQPAYVRWYYRNVSRHALWFWCATFRLTNHPRRIRQAHRLLASALANRLADSLTRSQPDLVVTVHPFLTHEAMRALENLPRPIPLVITYTETMHLHAAWLTERNAAAHFAPTPNVYAQARTAGIADNRLHLSGWPVRRQFYDVRGADRAETLIRLGLDPARFTVFLQGGGEGAGRFAPKTNHLRRLTEDLPLQFILAAGTNRAVLQRFSDCPHVRALPFTREIAPLMAAADVIMGKPGAAVVFESIVLGKPFVASAMIPGQEEGNLDFIEQHNIGWRAMTARAQYELLEQLVIDPDSIRQQIANVCAYRQRNMDLTARIPELVRSVMRQVQEDPSPCLAFSVLTVT